jgi:hypothetical protein
MSKHTRPTRRKTRGRPGRPPAGARSGEKVRDYPHLSIRLPREAKLKLGALSVLKSQPQWRIVLESIECFIRSLPESEQRTMHELMKRRG